MVHRPSRDLARLILRPDPSSVVEKTELTQGTIQGVNHVNSEVTLVRAGSTKASSNIPVLSTAGPLYTNKIVWLLETGEQSLVLGSQQPGLVFSARRTTSISIPNAQDFGVAWESAAVFENHIGGDGGFSGATHYLRVIACPQPPDRSGAISPQARGDYQARACRGS